MTSILKLCIKTLEFLLFVDLKEFRGRRWKPLSRMRLHPAVLDENADAETAYLNILLQEQAW